ncbi:hypothetical protein CY34DRAFT_383039 [Suillus luteus UH-Slu-Lm8-n1]|uniref:Uncharacterized protein n=1 Tax=Suillus luteus UH-Slu-Lm8-n1 TaxID=930992 RepID=A0A0D0AKG9_9AGAM|nr:hypothetical protein CY34DRAFT_383039 [Suillus luteus UH-Slu-Lm8-n1]
MFLQRYFSHWWIEMPTKKLSIRVTCSATVRSRRQAPRTWYRPNFSYFEPRTFVRHDYGLVFTHGILMRSHSPWRHIRRQVTCKQNQLSIHIINICHLSTLFSNTNHSNP